MGHFISRHERDNKGVDLRPPLAHFVHYLGTKDRAGLVSERQTGGAQLYRRYLDLFLLFNDYFTGHVLVTFAAEEVAMKFISAGLRRHDVHPRDFWGYFKM
jgi:hypothetical protein